MWADELFFGVCFLDWMSEGKCGGCAYEDMRMVSGVLIFTCENCFKLYCMSPFLAGYW